MKIKLTILSLLCILLTFGFAPAGATPLLATPTPSPIAPSVVATVPERGAEHPFDKPIEIKFDQAMNRASVEKAFAIEPGASVDGTFAWDNNDQTMRFSLKKGFERGTRYRLRIMEGATSQSGAPLTRLFELRFSTIGFLEVSSVQPSDKATEILPETIVTVAFNRPVVALSALESAGSLPDPLTFMPPVTGQGKWLNTSVYQFTPDKDLAPSTEYTARVAKGLPDALGQTQLVSDFTWKFSTMSPAVVGSMPANGTIYVSPTSVISVTFNQLMNHRSVEENFSLTEMLISGQTVTFTAQAVKGKFAWAQVGLTLPQQDDYGNPLENKIVGVETMIFSPTEPLKLDMPYAIMLPSGTLGSATATKTSEDYSAGFTTAAAPKVVKTDPADGTEFVGALWSANVVFNTPMDPSSVFIGKNITLDPLITYTEVYSYWNNNDTELSLNFPAELNTAYTLTLKVGIKGRYGQPLSETTTVHWNTMNNVPSIRFLSPRVATYNGYEPTRLYLTSRNLNQIHLTLHKISGVDFIRLNGDNWVETWEKYQPDPSSSVLIKEWDMETTATEAHINFIHPLTLTTKTGDALKPGIYYLAGSADPKSIAPQAKTTEIDLTSARTMLVVSKNNLTLKQSNGELLAWVTDLKSGQPVPNLPVSFISTSSQTEGDNKGGVPVGEAKSDKDGVAWLKYKATGNNNMNSYFAFVDDPTQFAASTTSWDEGIRRYDFRNINVEDWRDPYNGYVYTDRRIYRPGQTINFKAIVRDDDDSAYSLPPAGDKVNVIITDSRGRDVVSQSLTINAMGTVNGRFQLDEGAGLGYYGITARYQDSSFYNNFNVAEYRKPEFLVKVTADKPEYTQGASIKVVAESKFFFGGAVANSAVRWNVLSDDYYFHYKNDDSYSFTDEDYRRFNSPDFFPGYGVNIASGEGQTNKDGLLTFTVPADIATQHTSQQFTLETVVTGLNNQEVANQTTAIVHKGDFYVGLRPKEYVGVVGKGNQVELIVVDPQSLPVSKQEVELVFAEQQFYSVQQENPEAKSTGNTDDKYYWENMVESIAIFSTTVTTGLDGKATAVFTPTTGGLYKIYARAVDRNAHQIFSSTYLWVSGGAYINWGQANNDRLELVADKREYQVGEVAKVLIPHPYSGTVKTLVTLERGHIYSYSVTSLKTNSDQIEIPITQDMVPNMFVAVAVVKGVDETNKAASFKVGYVNLPIAPQQKKLHITLTPNKTDTYKPGDTVEYQVKVTDMLSKPVKAELSLALIDKAILTLAPDQPGRLLEIFWRKRGLGVHTGSGLTLEIARLNQTIDAKKGGGGGGPDDAITDIRDTFADAPLWVADFATNEQGEGKVKATLPDNLTTWVLLGKGVTGADTLVGEGEVEILSSKPLLVRPVTPRFFVMGDQVRLGMIVQNNSGRDLTIEPTLESTGLDIKPMAAQKAISFKNGDETKVEYDVTVKNVETVRLTMTAKSANLSDAIVLELPSYHFSSPETVATVGELAQDGSRTEAVALPSKLDPTQGDLTVKIDHSLAAGMAESLDYLEHYPYECTEQTVSRFLPNVFTMRAYQTLKLKNPDLEKRLPALVNTGLQRLYNGQHDDGGWGWWLQGDSDPAISAYVLLGLVEARRVDVTPVNEEVINQAVIYLQNNLLAPKDVLESWQGNRQAFILYVLAEAGQGDQGRMTALFDKREQLDMFGRAYLMMAMHLLDKNNKRIATLLDEIKNGAITSASSTHWEESKVDFYAMNTDTRSTAIIMAALSRVQPENPLLPQAVRWLMSIREHGGHWQTTQENAWAIIGLTDWLAVSGDLAGNYAWKVSLNGDNLSNGQVSPANIANTMKLKIAVNRLLTDAVNRLSVERDPSANSTTASKGNLYYAAYLTYYKPVPEAKSVNRGIMVSRQYSLAKSGQFTTTAKAINEAKVGEVIQVTLNFVVPNDLHYVVVEDPLPAGAEAIDSSLATTSVMNSSPEMNRTDRTNPWGDSRWYFVNTELRDEKAVLFATFLPKGTYQYTYLIRAAVPGEYQVIPTHAEEMYFPEVFGNGDGGVFKVVAQ